MRPDLPCSKDKTVKIMQSQINVEMSKSNNYFDICTSKAGRAFCKRRDIDVFVNYFRKVKSGNYFGENVSNSQMLTYLNMSLRPIKSGG